MSAVPKRLEEIAVEYEREWQCPTTVRDFLSEIAEDGWTLTPPPLTRDEFVEGTRLIRRWLDYQTVATDPLVAELRKWADYFKADPSAGVCLTPPETRARENLNDATKENE